MKTFYGFDISNILHDQRLWSKRTFGPGDRTEGVMKHIESEINEVRNTGYGTPERLEEFADIFILLMDAVWRNDFRASEFAEAVIEKQEKNFKRKWPEPGLPADVPVNHVSDKALTFEPSDDGIPF